jgi:Tfp pilus assembly major pilin PilA
MKSYKRMAGVTLLEVMLVLAVAAMIIVMSVRYYQAASANQQVNGALQFVQGVTAAADGLAQGTGSYTDVTAAQLSSIMPNTSMNLPWGSLAVWTATNNHAFKLTLPNMATPVCAQFTARMKANTKYTVAAACASIDYDNSL